MEEPMSREHSVRSKSSGHSFNLRDIHTEFYKIEEHKVYVAVDKEVQSWIENLRWLFNSINKNLPIVFLHVHPPAQRIAIPQNGLEHQELSSHRQLEKEMNECLKNFKATALLTDNDDIARGLLELVKQHKVTDLVMGAGSARTFSILPNSRMREPHQNAPSASNLYGSSSNHFRPSRSQSMPLSQPKQIIGPSGLDRKSRSVNAVAGESFPIRSPHPSYYSGFENLYPQSSSSSSYQSLFSEVDNSSLISDSLSVNPPNNSLHSFHNVTEDIYTRLEEMAEVEKLKQEAYEESNWCTKANWDLVQANTQIKMLKAEMQKKSQIEEKFARQSIELENYRKMYEQAQNELMQTNEILSFLDLQNAQLRQTVAELQGMFEEKRSLRETPELKRHGSSSILLNCREFTYSEIKEATKIFDPLQNIGEGGYGAVYKGFLLHTRVAIKILNRDSIQGDPQFFQEIEILSRIRHPHLVTLIGACLEARALVYEYHEQGSLDKYLTCNDQKRPLPWKVRVRVAREICSALIFLHTSRVVHGDLKPENVLLDSNFMVKLSDFGICRKVHETNMTTTPHHITDQPKGTLPYMDPEYLGSGELTPQYDVFSFGIVLLQLVTGKEAMGLKNAVVNAIENRQIEKMVDQSAGWPLKQAKKMIHIGLWCSDAIRKKRPDLRKDVWGCLKSIKNDAFHFIDLGFMVGERIYSN